MAGMESPADVRADRARGALLGLALFGDPTPALSVAAELLGGPPAAAAAAGRVVPVGIGCPPEPAGDLLALVEATDQATHDTRLAHAGAAAAAMAVSAGIEGWDAAEVLTRALTAAADGGRRARGTTSPDVGARIAWACGLARGADDPCAVIELLVGASGVPQEDVPAAFAIVAVGGDPWASCQAAAGLGGDSRSVAAMVAAMLGARHGVSAFPADAVAALLETLRAADPAVDLYDTADALVALRVARTAQEETQ